MTSPFTPNIEALIYIFEYKEPINNLIITGKYLFMPEIFASLSNISFNAMDDRFKNIMKDFILCPIPLHKRRIRWRGFNQSTLIAKTLGDLLKIPCINLITRHKNTKTQKDLTAKDRAKNMKNCFAINQKLSLAIKAKNIILIDDVATTGSTLESAAHILKLQGVNKIWAFVLAKD